MASKRRESVKCKRLIERKHVVKILQRLDYCKGKVCRVFKGKEKRLWVIRLNKLRNKLNERNPGTKEETGFFSFNSINSKMNGIDINYKK